MFLLPLPLSQILRTFLRSLFCILLVITVPVFPPKIYLNLTDCILIWRPSSLNENFWACLYFGFIAVSALVQLSWKTLFSFRYVYTVSSLLLCRYILLVLYILSSCFFQAVFVYVSKEHPHPPFEKLCSDSFPAESSLRSFKTVLTVLVCGMGGDLRKVLVLLPLYLVVLFLGNFQNFLYPWSKGECRDSTETV